MSIKLLISLSKRALDNDIPEKSKFFLSHHVDNIVECSYKVLCPRHFCSKAHLTHFIYAQQPIKGISANSVDPDQIWQNVTPDQGLHCLHYIQDFS